MEFRQLRYFLAVAEHLHFTIAAERLGIAQPPLSQQIIKLEREIGTKLFFRYPRRVELTEAGTLFRESAKRILEDADYALAQVKKAARGESGSLSIGFAGSTVFHPLVATVMRQFRQGYPGVSIKSEESNSTTLLQTVMDGKVDCALVRLPLNCRDLDTVPLVEEEMVAVLPSGHHLGRLRSIELAQLSRDPLILFPRHIGPDLYDSIISACHIAGFSPQIEMESPQISSTVNMVAAGFGVTLIPESIRQIHATGVTYQKIKHKVLRTTIALVHRPREKSATVQNLVRILRTVAQQRSVKDAKP
ncbi:LysR family transcriptional regulator [Acerihabitans sp.]|uniref:LysR family transcriptional regulator n=1 Tax=Acerihabitans sp. TaxID=2811394 RepID=UPI002EDB9039